MKDTIDIVEVVGVVRHGEVEVREDEATCLVRQGEVAFRSDTLRRSFTPNLDPLFL